MEMVSWQKSDTSSANEDREEQTGSSKSKAEVSEYMQLVPEHIRNLMRDQILPPIVMIQLTPEQRRILNEEAAEATQMQVEGREEPHRQNAQELL